VTREASNETFMTIVPKTGEVISPVFVVFAQIPLSPGFIFEKKMVICFGRLKVLALSGAV
jgi:hypothetical protein